QFRIEKLAEKSATAPELWAVVLEELCLIRGLRRTNCRDSPLSKVIVDVGRHAPQNWVGGFGTGNDRPDPDRDDQRQPVTVPKLILATPTPSPRCPSRAGWNLRSIARSIFPIPPELGRNG